jgi:hypothetical protein
MAGQLVNRNRHGGGKKENDEALKYGNRHGQIEFGHLHLGDPSEALKSDVTSGVMLQAFDSRHYVSLDNDGPRQGWTLNRCPSVYGIQCATDNAGTVNSEKGVGFFVLSETGDVVIRAPKGRIRLSALDIDIRADGFNNKRGSINLDSNQSINLKTGTFDVQANVGARIFTPKTMNLVANTSMHLVSNFMNGITAASVPKPNKEFRPSTREFNQKSLYD